MTRTAFVTGSTGFVGLNLVQRLVAQGWDVTALHRASSDLRFLRRFEPRLAVGEITQAASVRAALPAACDTVFHVAGNTNMWRRGNAEQTRDNVDGTLYDADLSGPWRPGMAIRYSLTPDGKLVLR